MKQCMIDFHPKFLHRRYGIDYGERYHRDPLFREEEELRVKLELHREFGGRFPGLFPLPEPLEEALISVNLQPLDFLNGAWGGMLHYAPDEMVWTTDHVLSHLNTLDAVERAPDIDWEHNPLWLDCLRQIEILQTKYPKRKLEVAQFALVTDFETGGAVMSIHSPYTTLFRLLGEDIFILMMTEEELAMKLMKYVLRQYQNCFDLACRTFNLHQTGIHYGDCAATMLSPELLINFNLKIAEEYHQEKFTTMIHSCGPSTHLLEGFKLFPGVQEVQFGFGTDLAKARAVFPGQRIMAYYAASALLNQTPQQVGEMVRRMAAELEDHFIIAASAVDPDTSSEVLERFFMEAENINQKELISKVFFA